MNANRKQLAAIVVLTLAALAWLVLPAPAQDRFFDTATASHQGVRLVVFHPTLGRVKDLMALRSEKLIDLANLTVIGVYHQKEDFDVAAAKALVAEKHLDWFKFHEVRVAIDPKSLFQANALSPELERIFRASDGMIFTGGPDIPPAIYGAKTSLLTVIEDPARHEFELSALFQLLGGSQNEAFKPLLDSRPQYPVLAICLGAQSLNVATGGTLIQDIWNEVYGKTTVEDILPLGLADWHTNPYAKLYPTSGLETATLQPIAPVEGGKLIREVGLAPGAHPYILSAHHQSIARLGRNLRVEATSLDGKVVESVSHTKYANVLAVQFHPENAKLWSATVPYKLSPEETAPPSWKDFLAAHPPSLDFHKKLWGWFASKLAKQAS